MLAVIEHHEKFLIAECIDHALRHRATLARLDRERSRDHVRKSLRIGQRPELNQPGAIAEPLQELRRDLHCETGLTHTTDTRKCDDARLLERLDDVGHVVVAPDERGRLEREVRRERLDGAKRGKVARSPACTTWKIRSGLPRSRRRCSPRSTSSTDPSRTSPPVARDTTI